MDDKLTVTIYLQTGGVGNWGEDVIENVGSPLVRVVQEGDLVAFSDIAPDFYMMVLEVVMCHEAALAILDVMRMALSKRKADKCRVEIDSERVEINLERGEWDRELNKFVVERISAKKTRAEERRYEK